MGWSLVLTALRLWVKFLLGATYTVLNMCVNRELLWMKWVLLVKQCKSQRVESRRKRFELKLNPLSSSQSLSRLTVALYIFSTVSLCSRLTVQTTTKKTNDTTRCFPSNPLRHPPPALEMLSSSLIDLMYYNLLPQIRRDCRAQYGLSYMNLNCTYRLTYRVLYSPVGLSIRRTYSTTRIIIYY